MIRPTIYAALDTTDLDLAKKLGQSISETGVGLKLGLTFFNAHGPAGVKAVKEACADNVSIFLDLKFHDIPAQVAGCVRAVSSLGVDYINVHASGGFQMMEEAKKAASEFGDDAPDILAVTVLTSLDEDDLDSIGQMAPIEDQVKRLALLARSAGMVGVVCSPKEIDILRKACGESFVLMTPGIRPLGSVKGDQKRVMTPKKALEMGSTHLVIGRPITQAADPAVAAQAILDEINA